MAIWANRCAARCAIALALAIPAGARAASPPELPASAGACASAYAEDLSALSPRARDIDATSPSYSYAVRTSATYECVSYGVDGNLKRATHHVTAYGTAFGYRRDGSDTLLLTNEHVAEWPAVTDDDHPVDGVPPGCKRVGSALAIVDNDEDDYAADDVALSLVVADPRLDVAVLRAHRELPILPWRIGKSASLTARAVVEVKGYPLGAFQATNLGKVVSAYDHDDFGDWDHDDFVIDALLSHGNSGSPVLAVSCKTGEFELVGIYHANYTGGTALNVAIAIDQVRDLMTTLKRSPRAHPDLPPLDAEARTRVVAGARGEADPPFFSFGGLVASVRARGDGSLVFAVFGPDFPETSRPLLVIEDLPGAGFGKLGAVYLGGARGLVPYGVAEGDADGHAVVARTLDVLREDAVATFDDRLGQAAASRSHDAYVQEQRTHRALVHLVASQHDAAQAVQDLAARTSISDGATVRSLAQLEADVPPAALAVTR